MNDDRFLLPTTGNNERSFVSRAGAKLDAALHTLHLIDAVRDARCADLGANVGGFSDCLLQHGAAAVYAVDTAYGVLAWTLRKDPRVIVKERTNALHVTLPEKVRIITIDVGWTRQTKILPVARSLLAPGGFIITLIKPHYESDDARKTAGVLSESQSIAVLEQTCAAIRALGLTVNAVVRSPLIGQGGNIEFLAHITTPENVRGIS
jgi:23S rRNA (cytidine1920-2'-O)/16S rRNA (cytidine1409-2'-O)-methyltransferase